MLRTSKLLAVISMLLAILLIAEVPIGAVAPVLSNEVVSTETILEDVTEPENEPESEIVSELKGERTEYSKTFRLSDGTSMVAQYTMPVHYKDDKGEWVDYDNSLSVTEKEVPVLETQPTVLDEATSDSVAVATVSEEATFTTRRTEKKQMFKNRKSNTGISFSKETASENMVLVEKDEHRVSWGYKDIKPKSAKQKNEKKTRTGNDRFTVLDNLTSTVVYESAYDGVDIECITTPVGVKENIILNKKSATNKFVSTYDIGDLRAEKLNDREIALYNADNEIVYYINALYMYDANNETSEDIILNILENINGKLVVELVADEQWLDSSERAYPVTIDPSFFYGQEWGEVQCTYVNSAYPNTAYGYGSETGYTGTIYAGNLGSTKYLSLIKINELPTLNKGDMIVGATVNLGAYNTVFPNEDYVGIYQITDDWTQDQVTWNNKPRYENLLIDYFKTSDLASNGYWYQWDITKLVKKWYNGVGDSADQNNTDTEANNYGFYIKMVDDNTTQNAGFYSSNYPSSSGYRPVFVLAYRNNKGLENYWNYTSLDIGSGVTTYVNDYSGALTVSLPLATTSDPIMPASINIWYNTYMANEKYDTSTPSHGRGWKMNIQQTLLPSTEYGLEDDAAEKYPYVYTDEDGTEHYFEKITEDNGTIKYCDEDGLDLELTINSDSYGERYIITDKDKNQWSFHYTGLLNRIKDPYGNYIKLNYDSRTIESVEDTTGNINSFEWNENKYITKMTDPDGKSIKFTYTGNKVTKITYYDNTYVQMTYDENNGGILTSVIDKDGYKVQFGYNSQKQVASYTEYGANGGTGQTVAFERTGLNETKIYTNGVDGINGTTEDCTTIYQYDNWGRTVSTQTSTNDGSELGASSATYTSGSNINTINKVTDTHALGSNAVNYILNSNLEGTSKWYNTAWLGDATYTIGWNNLPKLYGQQSFSINTTAYTGEGAGSIYQDVTTLAPETTYTLSGYVKVGTISASNATNYGALVGVGIYNSDGSIENCFSECISEVADTAINDGWRRVSVTFTTPENFTKVRVHLAMKSTIGLAYFDGIQLEKAENASPFNFVQNGSMELYSNNQPTYWNNFSNINFSASADGISQVTQHGTASFRIMGDVTKNKILYQEIPVSGAEEDTYILSAWAKTTTAVPIEGNIKFKITVQVWFSDDTYVVKDTPSFNTAITSWQYLSAAFNLSDETDTEKTPTKIKIFPNYSLQGNRAYFDNIQLIKEPAQSYTYDDEGNLVSVVATAEQNSSLKYNTANKLTEYTDPKGYKNKYTYDENKGSLKTATTQRGAEYTYDYDTRGSVKEQKGETEVGHKIKTSESISYPNDKSISYSVTNIDELKHSTISTYDAKDGTLTKVKSGIAETSYEYETKNDILTKVIQGESGKPETQRSISYDYDDKWKNLKRIETGTSQYNFNYDEFGKCTTIDIGTNNLITKDYDSNSGLLTSSLYGNNYSERYEYDKYGNVNKVYVKNSPADEECLAYEYIADNTGSITKVVDHLSNLKYNYVCDSTNRLISSTRTNKLNNTRVAMFEYDFDLNNNLTKLAVLTPRGNNVTNYEYGVDNQPISSTFSNGKKLTYNYDSLGRVKNTTLDITNNIDNNITTSYTYCHYDEDNYTYRSNLIETEKIGDIQYKYVYDDRNNITEIQNVTGSGDSTVYTPIEKYTYDSLDQLIQVDYLTQKKRVKYTYDLGGNILSESIYTLSGDTESFDETITYTYDEGCWGDKLKVYNKKILNTTL